MVEPIEYFLPRRIFADLIIGPGQSLLATLLRKHVSIQHTLAKQQLEFALDKLLRRSYSFQSVTAISPVLELCQSVDDIVENNSDEVTEALVAFIEESFFKFIQQPYSF